MSSSLARAALDPDLLENHPRRWLRFIALAAVATLAVTLGATALSEQPANAADPVVVSLTFDDSNADQMPAAATLASKGLVGTFFVNSGFLNQPGYMTNANLTTLATAGNEIGGHTRSHPDLVQVPADEAKRQICNDRVALSALGYPITSFAYPFASATPAIEQIALDCGYNSARGLGDLRTAPGTPCADCAFAETVPPEDPFWTRAADQVDSTWTLAQLQSTVTNASAGGGWVQLTFHHICDGCDELAISNAVFDQFTTWLAGQVTSAAVVVKTVGSVIGGAVKPVVAGPDFVPPPPAAAGVNALQNSGFEEIAAEGIPRCWWDSVFGINTATFSTVSPGRSGANAAQILVSGYTSGDAKRLQIFDGGACAPTVVAGQSYSLRAWYKSTANTQFTVYYRLTDGSWIYGTSSAWFGPATDYASAVWTTPAIPANVNGLSFALNVFSNGQLTVDDYSMYNTIGAPALDLVAPVPTITGVPKVATPLTANAGVWGPAPVTLAYQWSANGTALPGATLSTYTPTTTDAGKTITVSVTGSKAGFVTVTKTSAATAAVTSTTLVSPVPTITGTARVGTPLIANAGVWGPAPVALSYQWLANGVVIRGAIAPIYIPRARDVGQKITVRVTGTKTGYTTVAQTSAATAAVLALRGSRVSGADRFETSAQISATTFNPGVPIAYVATGTNFPDALSGGAAAGAIGGPVLLVTANDVPQAIRDELVRLAPERIVLLGSTAVVSASVEAALALIAPTTRVAGADRFETSARISAAAFGTGVPVAYIATGSNFPDALSGGAAAGAGKGPLLIVSQNSIPNSIRTELLRLKPVKIVVLGSASAVSDSVAKALNAIAPTTRYAGADRYATSSAISNKTFAPGVAVVYLAIGTNFPDALSGSAAGVINGAPVLLVTASSIPDVTKAELARLKPHSVVVLGGSNVISDAVLTQAQSYVQ